MTRLIRVATVALLVTACSRDVRDDASPDGAQEPPATHTLADFQALRYLEGDWRGSGYEGGPFYESYRFVNDSTIELTAWTDSTMTTPRERSEYGLRGGVITHGSGRLVSVDEGGHHFRSSSSAWTFRPVSPDRWTAQVGPATTYTMDRITRR